MALSRFVPDRAEAFTGVRISLRCSEENIVSPGLLTEPAKPARMRAAYICCIFFTAMGSAPGDC